MAEKEKAPQALATEVTVNEAIQNDYVTIMVPRAPARSDQTLFVSVNGQVWNIPRGKTVTLPKYVTERIEDMIRRKEAYEQAVAETYESDRLQYLNNIDR